MIGKLCDTIEMDQRGSGHKYMEQLVAMPPNITFAWEITFWYT
jgi:hypothetical protein